MAEQLRREALAGGDLPCRDTDPAQQLDCLSGEGRADEPDASLVAMLPQPPPLCLRELHPLPVGVATVVLVAERDPPWFVWGAFGGGDVGLELDRVDPGRGGYVDERVREAQAAIVTLGHLGDHRAAIRGDGERVRSGVRLAAGHGSQQRTRRFRGGPDRVGRRA